jgi:hypothetical protein
MLKHELGKKPPEFKTSVYIGIPLQTAFAIGKMYSKVLKEVYSVDMNPKSVCMAIADMTGITAALRDKTGIKKLLLSSIEKALGKLPMLSSMILPLEVKDSLDYLNTSHSTRYLPWDNSTALTSSFTESFDAAAMESKKIIEAIILFIKGDLDSKTFQALIGNRSFSTGEDCSKDLEFKYFDCIYE